MKKAEKYVKAQVEKLQQDVRLINKENDTKIQKETSSY